jgi:hypothetical protein
MRDFTRLRGCLNALAENADVLPATGGAQQWMLQPDQEERDDDAVLGEGICDRWGETPAPRTMDEHVECQQVPRTERNRFRFFLDGAMRTYYLASITERNVTEPILYAEIGAAVMERLDNGTLSPFVVESGALLAMNLGPFSESLQVHLKGAAEASCIQLLDTGPETLFTRRSAESAARAQGCIRWQMREMERELMQNVPEGDHWIVIDGSIASHGSRQAILPGNVLGVAKSFAKSPKFRTTKTAQPLTVTRLVASLPVGHRTPLFVNTQGDAAFWYARLWPQGAVDYPLMGVVKCDLQLRTEIPVIARDMANELTGSLLCERRVTPYGKDARWHSLLYPIHVTEQVIRSRFTSPLMLREGLAREWSRVLRGAK